VSWNRLYEPALIARDAQIKTRLQSCGVTCRSVNGSLLLEPWQNLNKSERPFRVFTPFWKAHQSRAPVDPPRPPPDALPSVPDDMGSLRITDLHLLPDIPWDQGLRATWSVGEEAAHAELETFLNQRLSSYAEDRDRPDRVGTSRLSPYLHCGQLSPRQVMHAVESYTTGYTQAGLIKGADVYKRELGWREFAYHLLYHFPDTVEAPLNPRFKLLPWRNDSAEDLAAWQGGQTGFPIVDAGMRELWHTGWMHNRVRMLVASLLTKNLRIHWKEGERWFWDTLVDADLANNVQGWQWTAGCGADAAPYFRIFNPVLQGERYDPAGVYVRRWIPEIAKLPNKFIHKPWEAPNSILNEAGIQLRVTYPWPIVDLKTSRRAALEAFERVKQGKKGVAV
jgi:deoxyribodipyrimidine photo-lyase